jgi:hypothetical protein
LQEPFSVVFHLESPHLLLSKVTFRRLYSHSLVDPYSAGFAFLLLVPDRGEEL